IDFDLRVRWANPTFEHFCCADPVGHGFYEALGRVENNDEFCPFHSALASRPSGQDGNHVPAVCVSSRLRCRGPRFLDLHVSLLPEPAGSQPLFIALAHDSTTLVQQQQKLDALYRAGRELTALDGEQMADLSFQQRVELLKGNVRRLTRDLLQYELFEILLLDHTSGKLTALVQDGMTLEAQRMELRAAAEGNGVSGFVAATGRSHLCRDTLSDPLYVQGAPFARSSLTVPLRFNDRIVGTFNVESPRPGAFGEA